MSELPIKTVLIPSEEKWSSLPAFSRLSNTQMEYLTASVNGLDNDQIAVKLGVKPVTVKTSFNDIIRILKTFDCFEFMPDFSRLNTFHEALINEGFFIPVESNQ